MTVTNYFQVERFLKKPLKSVLIIYTIYLLVNAYTYFELIVVPELPLSTNWTEAKWMVIWSMAYFFSFFILISIYKHISIMCICGDENIFDKNNNLIEELFDQSFRSSKPIVLGFLFSFAELFAGKVMFGTVTPWLDDSIVMFLIGIVLCIFIYVLIYVLKIGEILRQNFEKYDDSTNIVNLFKTVKQNKILAFSVLISTSILILSIISAILIVPAFFDVFRYSYKLIGYLFLIALVIIPPLAFLSLIYEFS